MYAKFQLTGCNDFHLYEHCSKILVLPLSSQTQTDNCKSVGDTAVLILHFCSEAKKSTLSERVLHYCFHATYRGTFEVALYVPCSTSIAHRLTLEQLYIDQSNTTSALK